MVDKVLNLNKPAHGRMTCAQALDNALELNPTDVLIVGYKEDGSIFLRSSNMTNKDALWLLEMGKLSITNGL